MTPGNGAAAAYACSQAAHHHTAHLPPPPLGVGPITQPHQAVRSQHHTATGWPRSMQESGLAPRGHLLQAPPQHPASHVQGRCTPPWCLVAGLEVGAGLHSCQHNATARQHPSTAGAGGLSMPLGSCMAVYLSVSSISGALPLHSHTTSTVTVKVVACEPAGQPVAD